jgi:hypothetical protein
LKYNIQVRIIPANFAGSNIIMMRAKRNLSFFRQTIQNLEAIEIALLYKKAEKLNCFSNV